MNLTKKVLTTAIASTVLATSAVVSVSAQAEVAASIAIANTYLWRGYDLGDGDAMVSGDVSISTCGAHAGIWVASGDSAMGQEYDLWVGYGGETGGLSYDLSLWTYSYPRATSLDLPASVNAEEFVEVDASLEPGDLTEAVLSLGYGAFSLGYYDNIAGGSGYTYTTLGASAGDFSILYGSHKDGIEHIDISYSVGDITLTDSTVSDDPADGQDDTNFVISYSLPL